MAFEPRNLAESMATRLVVRADQAYVTGDWATALPLYRHVLDAHPEMAAALGLAVSAGHCAIELADDTALASSSETVGPPTGSARETAFAHDIRVRAMVYCREGAFTR